MAHYALLDENNIVFQVITGRDENEVLNGVSDWESYYGNLHGCKCKRTSYNTSQGIHINGGVPFRLNYAGVGMKYDESLDGFVDANPPYDDWVFDESMGIYKPPIDFIPNETKYKNPETNKMELRYEEYPVWDQDAYHWKIVKRFDKKENNVEFFNEETGQYDVFSLEKDNEADQTA